MCAQEDYSDGPRKKGGCNLQIAWLMSGRACGLRRGGDRMWAVHEVPHTHDANLEISLPHFKQT